MDDQPWDNGLREAGTQRQGGGLVAKMLGRKGVDDMSRLGEGLRAPNGESKDLNDRDDLNALALTIKTWARELGFQAVGIADVDLSAAEPLLLKWLARGFHGEMDYMARHGVRRARPAELVPGTVRVISVRLDYMPAAESAEAVLADSERAFVARYALGRDYHKVLRGRLQQLADRIAAEIGEFGHRVFTDSAPVMEVELARKRSEERRVGKECRIRCRSRWSPYH